MTIAARPLITEQVYQRIQGVGIASTCRGRPRTSRSRAVLSMQKHLGKPQEFSGIPGCSPLHKIGHLPAPHNRKRALLVSAGKRSSKDKSGRSSQGPLYITIEADGSDLWRLDPVISMLQEGAVGLILASCAVLPQTSVCHSDCNLICAISRTLCGTVLCSRSTAQVL